MRKKSHLKCNKRDTLTRRNICLLFFIVLIPLLFFSACDDQRIQTVSWTEYEPVYMPHEEFIRSAGFEEARELENPGKIYLLDDYLFVNEVAKGVHIIDNQDPSSPQFVGFVNIPGNKNMAVRGDRLYADSSTDLLVFDVSDFDNPELISRREDVFDMTIRQTRFPYREPDPSKGVVVDWEPVEVEEVCRRDCHRFNGGLPTTTGFRNQVASDVATGTASAGRGGSMARFTIAGDYLYVVDWDHLFTFDISAPDPEMLDEQHLGWMIETIFPYNDNLCIGSGNTMYIYDISNPVSPEQLSTFRHATACDPVVVENDYAFVTLRDGELCPNTAGTNQLEVIDLKDLLNPERIGKYEMINPQGLGIDNGDLFISEGDHGLKIMDASDPYDIKELRHLEDIRTYDVIPNNGILIVTGASGIIQYDYSDIGDLNHLSTIPANSPKL
jgi:hypothetical protein